MRRPTLLRALLALFAVFPIVVSGGTTARGQSVETLRDRMAAIQEELDEATARIEELRTDQDNLIVRMIELDRRIDEIEESTGELRRRVVRRARSLYMGGTTGMLESLLSASNISELSDELEYATRVSDNDTALFVRYSRIGAELRVLYSEAEERSEELARVESTLDEEMADLQDRFADAKDDYEALKRRLAAQARRATQPTVAGPTTAAAPAPDLPRGSMTCPVDGPHSFIDSWGYPRSGGRSHEGTDIMAAEGTSVVAITDGTISYAGYGSSAGNWIVLSGNDGNDYWYLHNRENLVTGGSVRVGEQIATVGNTGNASGGAPHVHFEYHPGGGGPVNPYELLRGLCRGA